MPLANKSKSKHEERMNQAKKEAANKKARKRAANEANRPLDQTMFVIFGKTGVGKTTTIQNLIGNYENLQFQTSDMKSATRETSEYRLELPCKKQDENLRGKTVKLGIVDTPGIDDTDGVKQEARNMASIKTFFDQHKSLKRDPDDTTAGRRMPNLVMLMLNAGDERYVGYNTPLEKALRLMVHPEIQLTDGGKNLIVVLTHAGGLDKRTYKERTAQIRKEIQQKAKEITKHEELMKVPVVFMENKIDWENNVNGWAVLHNKELQPKNLFDAATSVFARNDDFLGNDDFLALFGRSGKTSKLAESKQTSIKASLHPEKLNSMENMFLQVLRNDYLQGDEEEYVSEPPKSNAHIGKTDKAAAVEEEKQEEMNQSSPKELMNILIKKVGSPSCGQCFDLVTKEILSKSALCSREIDWKNTKLTLSPDQTEKFNYTELGALDTSWTVKGDFDVSVFNMAGSVSKSSDEKDHTLLEEITFGKLSLNYDKIRKIHLDEKLMAAYQGLFTSFDATKSKHIQKFESFFKIWGHGVVTSVNVGGRLSGERTTTSLFGVSKERNYLGGDSAFHDDPENVSAWKSSLKTNPAMFVKRKEVGSNIQLHDEVIKGLEGLFPDDWDRSERARAMRKAIEFKTVPTKRKLAENMRTENKAGYLKRFLQLVKFE